MNARRIDWPTREEWEAEQRQRAQASVETGGDHWAGRATWNAEERAEVERLTPLAVKAIRREVGRIERRLRAEHPAAAEAARPIKERPITIEVIDRHQAAIYALCAADREAFEDLSSLQRVRDWLRSEGRYYLLDSPGYAGGYDWPDRYPHPTSPELERIRALGAAAIERAAERNRERGRKMLADLDSGAAWQGQLEHMASCEEFFRNGPVIRR